MAGRRGAAAAWLLSLSLASPRPLPLDAQTVATLEIGPSVVAYDGFLVSGAAIASPSLRYDTPSLSLGTQGTWVVFESGRNILQWTAAAAWITAPRGAWRAEFSGSIGISSYDASGFGHVLGRTRLHYQGDRSGGWVGAATGQSFGEFDATPFEVALGLWTVQDRLSMAASITGSTVDGNGYLDLVGAARWSTATVQFDAQAGLRPASLGTSGEVYGDLAALARVNDRISVVLSGGTYPSDPLRGVLGAKYITAGLRVQLFGAPALAPAPHSPIIAGALARAALALAESEHGTQARLVITQSGTLVTLRIEARDTGLVELMGDFTDWQPVALTRVGTGIWEITLDITHGVHRLNLRIDNGTWLVPAGTRLEETEFGGAVGVVLVP